MPGRPRRAGARLAGGQSPLDGGCDCGGDAGEAGPAQQRRALLPRRQAGEGAGAAGHRAL